MTAPSQQLAREGQSTGAFAAASGGVGSGKSDSTDKWNDEWTDEVTEDPPVKPLTREEAQALVAQLPAISPWRVLMAQALAGVLVTLLSGLITRSASGVVSALYGAAAVVVPGALLAWGLTSRPGTSPAALPVRFMFWEFVKLALACAMLVSAVRVVHDLNWPALLVAMVVCMKTSWLAPFWRRRPDNQVR